MTELLPALSIYPEGEIDYLIIDNNESEDTETEEDQNDQSSEDNSQITDSEDNSEIQDTDNDTDPDN
jgi:hypothetical protein